MKYLPTFRLEGKKKKALTKREHLTGTNAFITCTVVVSFKSRAYLAPSFSDFVVTVESLPYFCVQISIPFRVSQVVLGAFCAF